MTAMISVGMKFETRQLPTGYNIRSPNTVLVFDWECRYANSLDGAKLNVGFYDKLPRLPGVVVFDDPRTLESIRFEFKLIGPAHPAWVHGEIAVTPNDMAEYLMKRLMHHNELELRRRGK
jgi:hypothetical protein